MAKLQRYAVAFVALVSASAFCAIVVALGDKTVAHSQEIVLTVAADRSLTARNTTTSVVSLHSEIVVEQAMVGSAWERLTVQNLLLRSQCGQPKQDVVVLQPGLSLTALPWTGRHCASQCDESCRAEAQYPPGQYRYVVKTMRGVELTSSAFALP